MLKKIQFYFSHFLTETIAISVLSGMLAYYAIILLWPQSDIDDAFSISISKGSTLIDISTELHSKKVIKNRSSFILAVKMLDEFSKYRNFGRSATVAVLIFVCVLPIIVGTALRERENTQS